MKAHTASLGSALVLIVISAWGYVASATPSLTALLPAAFGLAVLACYPGVKRENKVISHIAVVLTLVVFVALFTPLIGAIGREDTLAIVRLVIMQAAAAIALVFFVKSFVDARRRR